MVITRVLRVEGSMMKPNHHLHKGAQAFIQEYQHAFLDVTRNYLKEPDAQWQDALNIADIYAKWLSEFSCKPGVVLQASLHWLEEINQFWEHLHTLELDKKLTAFIEPEATDRRFKGNPWRDNPLFYSYQQLYLLSVRNILQFIEKNPSHDPKITKQMHFFTKQFLDAVAPSNFLFTNPEILQRTIDTHGENLIKGCKNFVDDIIQSHGHFSISMTRRDAFKIGENIATTPGKVIYQNRMMQLIQYSPTTEKVYEKPILIIPPWINKFYILDLSTKNSFVKWNVDQGFTVFMISWVNPDETYHDVGFEDYLQEGIFSALDAITAATSIKEINALGFCIGGTLLATALGYMEAIKDKRIKSATFLTTLIDFHDAGDLEVFIDESQIETVEKRMDKEGYLDGHVLMNTFNKLRANDLIWSYYIHNYMLGDSPRPFDLLYWNADSSHLPAKMQSYYLRNMYLNNILAQGKANINGLQINLSKVKTPCYFLSTELDHIAPWHTTFMGAQCLGGDITFVLSGSGHIAGVVNPPVNQKYKFYYTEHKDKKINDKHFISSHDWLAQAKEKPGSWWEHWANWLKAFSGQQVKARMPAEGKLPIIEDAPGSYVKKSV